MPLSEDAELYRIRIVVAEAIISEYETAAPEFAYTAALQSADGISGSFMVEVAMVSSRFGAGPYRSVAVSV